MELRRRVSIFVPAYNEAENLEGAIHDIVGAAAAALEDYEVLLVDDGSTDGTGALADRLAQELPKVRVIHQDRNRGIAAGYVRALEKAELDYFGFLPADGEISPESIKDILTAVGTAEIVAPYHANARARARHRRFLTWAFRSLVNLLFGLRLRYYQGPCIYPTVLARTLPKMAGGFYFLTEMLVHAARAGHTYVEVGLIHRERRHGRSKAVSLRNIVSALRTVGTLWWVIHMRPLTSRQETAA